MSPCSKKLSDMKEKRFKKYAFLFLFLLSFYGKYNANSGLFVFSVGKPQSLFAKLGKKNFEQSSSAEQKGDTGEGQQ